MKGFTRTYTDFSLCGLACLLCPMQVGGYCPGCGGTRAVIALAHGQMLKALYYHPAVPVLAALGGVYLVSQTVWRMRGRRGWVLRYDPRWPAALAGLFLVNCAVRNLLWLGFGIGI